MTTKTISLKPDLPPAKSTILNPAPKANTVSSNLSITTKDEPTKQADKRLRDTDADIFWTVVQIPGCPYATQAVELLESRGEKYKVVNMDTFWQRKLIVDVGTKRTPAIYKFSNYFGGLYELQAYYAATFFTDSEQF